MLQEFDIIVLNNLGKENQVVEFLSLPNHGGEDIPINDNFPDENLLVISIKTPYFVDMANYLSTGKLPSYFSSNKKNRIIRKSVNYFWLKGYLFFTGPHLIIHRYVREDEIYDILRTCHNEPCGGHFPDKQTTYKILCSGHY